MEKNAIHEFISNCGGLAEFSRLSGVPKTTVFGWLERGYAPHWRQPLLAKIAKSRKVKIPEGAVRTP